MVFISLSCKNRFSALSSFVAEPKVTACVQKTCENSVDTVFEFIEQSKKPHKDLEKYYTQFENQLDIVRKKSLIKATESVQILKNKSVVQKYVRSLDKYDLIEVFDSMGFYNIEIEYTGRDYKLSAIPLDTRLKLQEKELIKKIFQESVSHSELYKAYLYSNYLNVPIRESLRVPKDLNLFEFARKKFETEILSLPLTVQENQRAQVLEVVNQVANLNESDEIKGNALASSNRLALTKVILDEIEIETIRNLVMHEIMESVDKNEALSELPTIFSTARWKNVCKDAFNKALHYSLTTNEKKQIQETTNEAYDEARDALFRYFGRVGLEAITQRINSMRVVNPMEFNEFTDYTRKAIVFELESLNKKLDVKSAFDFISQVSNDNYRLSPNETLCNGYIFDPARDMVTESNIILSSYSGKNKTIGKFIIIHELAHVISVGFENIEESKEPKKKFLNLRKCISKNYDHLPERSLYDYAHKKDKMWTEEDWADAFAAFALQGKEKDNPWCSFTKGRLDFPQTIVRDDENSHSPAFYRMLNSDAHLLGRISKECQQGLSATYKSQSITNCFID